MQMNLADLKDILQTFVLFANVCVIAFGFYKFLGKPHSTLENRVAVLEAKDKEKDEKLKSGNKRFDNLEEKTQVFINCMLAFIDFEIAFCQDTKYMHTEDLMKAKTVLMQYLSKK